MTSFNTLGTGRDTDGLDVFDEFTGFGGSLGGIQKVPGVNGRFAANHSKYALDVSARNYPNVEHFCGDVQRHDITKFQPCAIFWASPACPNWTTAKGVKRMFDRTNQIAIPGLEEKIDPVAERSRLLMDEVHRYLNAMWISGQPVLAGVVENVVECRKWADWPRWRNDFRLLGYETKLIAFNAMHARPVRARKAPQSRDRLWFLYWLKALGRTPDFDKWLRPRAWCPRCDREVDAVQSWKRPGADMGRYRQQYVYRCPSTSCRSHLVEPYTEAASSAIDWSLPSTRIGQRAEPLAPKTMARVGVGAVRFGIRVPTLAPAGGTWREAPTPVTEPMPTRTTRESDGLAVPPLLVPVEGRDGKEARPASEPARTQTCRNETGLATLPFVATLRGGGSAKAPNLVSDPLTTVTASGNHHGLVTTGRPYLAENTPGGPGARHVVLSAADSARGRRLLAVPPDMLVPYYSTGVARPASEPIGTLSTVDRYALARGVQFDPDAVMRAVERIEAIDKQIRSFPEGPVREEARIPLDAQAARVAAGMGLDDFEFRMLEPHEIAAAMAFDPGFEVFGSKRDQVRGFGNAVPGCVSEVLVSALVEAVTGVELERSL